MKCSECREEILDSIGQQSSAKLQDHISNCNECRRFAGIQQMLHDRFTSASSAQLSRNFRFDLRARLTRERTFVWPDYLPDIAHLLGGVIATMNIDDPDQRRSEPKIRCGNSHYSGISRRKSPCVYESGMDLCGATTTFSGSYPL